MSQSFTPETVLAMSRAFMESRILLTGAELDIFTTLSEHPLSALETAQKTGYHLRPLTILLDALTAMGLIAKENDRYRTEPSLAPLLSSSSPKSVLPMIRHAASIWKNWSNLSEIVRETGGPAQPSATLEDEDAQRAFIGAMHVVGAPQAAGVVAAIDSSGARAVIDVGGGSGTYTLAFLEANPNLRATLFDKPFVVELARTRFQAAGVLDRVALAPGDFYQDELPLGHDLAFVSAIIHMNSPEQNLDLYKKVYAALDPGGRIVIRDHVMNPDRTAPKAGAIFAVNMLCATPGGGTYTYEDIRTGLLQAGFTAIRLIQEGGPMTGLVEGFKPI